MGTLRGGNCVPGAAASSGQHHALSSSASICHTRRIPITAAIFVVRESKGRVQMFAWWGTIVSRLRWLILVLTIAFAAFAGIWGTGVFDKLQGDSSLNNPASESQVINQRVIDELGRQSVDLIALYSSDTLTVSDQQFRDPVTAVVAKLHTYPSVAKVISYYDTQAPTLVSTDQHETY